MKKTIILALTFLSFSALCSQRPNEDKIFFHMHQAIRWAELHYSHNILFARREIRQHLGKIKYSEVKLIKSLFYKEYTLLNKIALNLAKSNYQEIERLRHLIHLKAEQNKVQHPKNWQDEFILYQ